MDGFNLLPEEYRRRRGAKFAPISMLVTAAIVVVGVLLMERAVMARAASGSASSLGKALTARRAELGRRRQERLAILAEIRPLRVMLSQTPVWSNVFVDVATVVGPGVRITHWSSDAERGVCSLQGHARTNGEVFALVAALEGLTHFESVTLAGVVRESDEGDHGVRYEIVCRLRKAVW
jgi:Tfp pilus assembly protein PilN